MKPDSNRNTIVETINNRDTDNIMNIVVRDTIVDTIDTIKI